jgi:hypothetical protein
MNYFKIKIADNRKYFGSSLGILICISGLMYFLFREAFSGFFFSEDLQTRGLLISKNYNLISAMFTPFGPFFRPTAVVWSMGTQLLLPWDQWAHHLRNFLLTCFNAFLLLLILKEFTENKYVQFTALAFFAVSKVHMTTIGYINCIDNLGALLYPLVSFLFLVKFVKKENWTSYYFSLFFFLLTIFARDPSIVFIAAVFTVLFVFKYKDAIKLFLPFLGVAIIYLVIRLSLVNFAPTDPGSAYAIRWEWQRIFLVLTSFSQIMFNYLGEGALIFSRSNLHSVFGAEALPPKLNVMIVASGVLLFLSTIIISLRSSKWTIVFLVMIMAYLFPIFLIKNNQNYYYLEPLFAATLIIAIAIDGLIKNNKQKLYKVLVSLWLCQITFNCISIRLQPDHLHANAWRFMGVKTLEAYNAFKPEMNDNISRLILLVDKMDLGFYSYMLTSYPIASIVAKTLLSEKIDVVEVKSFEEVGSVDFENKSNLVFRIENGSNQYIKWSKNGPAVKLSKQ